MHLSFFPIPAEIYKSLSGVKKRSSGTWYEGRLITKFLSVCSFEVFDANCLLLGSG